MSPVPQRPNHVSVSLRGVSFDPAPHAPPNGVVSEAVLIPPNTTPWNAAGLFFDGAREAAGEDAAAEHRDDAVAAGARVG